MSADLAYAAGLFEGEGSLHVQHRSDNSRSPIAVMKISMTDEDVVRKFHEIVGVGSVGGPWADKRSESYKPIWRWTTYGSKAKALCGQLWPWLGQRRRERITQVFGELDDRVIHGDHAEVGWIYKYGGFQ